MVGQGTLWVILFWCLPSDRRCFASASLSVWVLGVLSYVAHVSGVDGFLFFFASGAFALSPLCVGLMLKSFLVFFGNTPKDQLLHRNCFRTPYQLLDRFESQVPLFVNGRPAPRGPHSTPRETPGAHVAPREIDRTLNPET